MAHRCGVRSVAGFAYRLSPSRLPRRCQQQREARDPRNSVDNVAVLSHPLDETPRRRVPGFYRFPLFGRAHRAAAAVAHGARLVLWQPWRTLRAPLVWILHVGYAWLVVHLAMRALAQFYLVPNALATHALTIGAIGSLTMAS